MNRNISININNNRVKFLINPCHSIWRKSIKRGQVLNSRRSGWRTTSAKGLKGNSWSKRASMGTRAAAFSSSDRDGGSFGAHRLGGNLLQDIRMYVSSITSTHRVYCSLNLLLKTTNTWWSGGRVRESIYNTLPKKIWIPVERKQTIRSEFSSSLF